MNGGRMLKNPMFIELEKLYDEFQVNRNFQCPEYHHCLADAAFQNLDLLCCSCPLRNTKQNLSISELEQFRNSYSGIVSGRSRENLP
jgi:hypothetical protein